MRVSEITQVFKIELINSLLKQYLPFILILSKYLSILLCKVAMLRRFLHSFYKNFEKRIFWSWWARVIFYLLVFNTQRFTQSRSKILASRHPTILSRGIQQNQDLTDIRTTSNLSCFTRYNYKNYFIFLPLNLLSNCTQLNQMFCRFWPDKMENYINL